MANLRGWIAANKEDAPLLESLGVKLGFYDDQFGGFEECQVCQRTLTKLLPYWGEFVWHFKPAGKTISQRSAA
jgi:hypothetical protein